MTVGELRKKITDAGGLVRVDVLTLTFSSSGDIDMKEEELIEIHN